MAAIPGTSSALTRWVAYGGTIIGVLLLVWLLARADLAGMLGALRWAGWRLLGLVPCRALFFLLYALGWMALLAPYDPERRAPLGLLFWVTTVREAIDRLLPVASVGGAVVGVRLLARRGIATAAVGATVIAEVLLTLFALYVFTLISLVLLAQLEPARHRLWPLVPTLALAMAVPIGSALVLFFGSPFSRIAGFLGNLVGAASFTSNGAALDAEMSRCLRRIGTLGRAGALQLVALLSASFEVWYVLRLFGHPVGWQAALIIEGLTQAVRHVAFMVPGALGVQEAGLMLFGHALGISGELALALSMAKRLRELVCGLPALLSWRWLALRTERA